MALGQFVPLGDQRLARLQQAGEAVGLRRRQAQNRAVFEERAIDVAARAVKDHAHAPLDFAKSGDRRAWTGVRSGRRWRRRRAGAWSGRTIVDNRAAGHVVGDRDRLDQRQRGGVQPVNEDGVAGLDRIGDLSGQMRRKHDLGAVGKDQTVDVAPRRQGKLLDLAALHRQLVRVVDGGCAERRGCDGRLCAAAGCGWVCAIAAPPKAIIADPANSAALHRYIIAVTLESKDRGRNSTRRANQKS